MAAFDGDFPPICAAPTLAGQSSVVEPEAALVTAMSEMGINEEHARFALSRSNNSVEAATTFCFSNDMDALVRHAAAFTSGDPSQDKYAAVADEHAECPVCFEPTCEGRLGELAQGGKRVCDHFFHVECCEATRNVADCARGEAAGAWPGDAGAGGARGAARRGRRHAGAALRGGRGLGRARRGGARYLGGARGWARLDQG